MGRADRRRGGLGHRRGRRGRGRRVGRRRTVRGAFALAQAAVLMAGRGGRAVRVLRLAGPRRARLGRAAPRCSPSPSRCCRCSTATSPATGSGWRSGSASRCWRSPRWRSRCWRWRARSASCGCASSTRSGALEIAERGPGARRPHRARWSASRAGAAARARRLHLRGLRHVPRARARRSRRFGRDPRVRLRTLRRGRATPTRGRAADIPGSPFAVALDADGTVLAKGTFNTGAQLESVLAAAERRAGRGAERRETQRPPGAASSRGSAAALMALAARDGRRAGRARRGRGLPLLRPHLHDRLLPAPDRAAAHRLAGLSAAGARTATASTTSAASSTARATRSTRTAGA